MMDVAREAGVSHQTVSRYFRDHAKGLLPHTAERIGLAIDKLGYERDLVARSMRTGRTYRIAVVLPESTGYVPVAMLRGAAQAATASGFTIDVAGIGGTSAERDRHLRELVRSQQLEGVLSLTPLDLASGRPLDLGVPVVVAGAFDEHMHTRGGLADGSAVADVVEHLVGLGHRRLVHVAGPMEWASARNRLATYLEAVQHHAVTSCAVLASDWTARGGLLAGREIPLEDGVTAVVAANDPIALGVVRALHEQGVRVPDDVSVVGWNDEEFGAFTTPSLSTVRVDLESIGRRAMLALLEALQGGPAVAPPDEAPTATLVLRESSGPAPSG